MSRWASAGVLFVVLSQSSALRWGENTTASEMHVARSSSFSDIGQIAPQDSPRLEDVLLNGLRARTDADRQFIKRVVTAVDDGVLSESLVRALFARARRENARYPMPYFIVLLRKIAAEKGVDI
jgi:hypothetical protein